MTPTGAFLTPLVMEDLCDGRHFKLWRPLEYVSRAGVHYVVPAGFTTDLNSSPRIAWRLYPPSNKANRAAVLHDFLYDTALVPKELADALYHEASEACGINKFVRWCAFKGVSWFGRGSWERDAEKRNSDLTGFDDAA